MDKCGITGLPLDCKVIEERDAAREALEKISNLAQAALDGGASKRRDIMFTIK